MRRHLTLANTIYASVNRLKQGEDYGIRTMYTHSQNHTGCVQSGGLNCAMSHRGTAS